MGADSGSMGVGVGVASISNKAPTATYATKYGVVVVCWLGAMLLVMRKKRSPARRLVVGVAVLLVWGGVASFAGGLIEEFPSLSESHRSVLNLVMYMGVLISGFVCWCLAFLIREGPRAWSKVPGRSLVVVPSTRSSVNGPIRGHGDHHDAANDPMRLTRLSRQAGGAGAVVLLGGAVAVGFFPYFLVAIAVSVYGGVALMVAVVAARCHRWVGIRGSKDSRVTELPQFSRAMSLFIVALLASIVGAGVAQSLAPTCYPHGDKYSSHCPLPKAFDQEALYHVFQIVGYILFAVGAASLASLPSMHGPGGGTIGDRGPSLLLTGTASDEPGEKSVGLVDDDDIEYKA